MLETPTLPEDERDVHASQAAGVIAMHDQQRSWHEFALTYQGELPEILHAYVCDQLEGQGIADPDGEHLLAQQSVVMPVPGEVTVPDERTSLSVPGEDVHDASEEEISLKGWRAKYGEEVTGQQAETFDKIVEAQQRASDVSRQFREAGSASDNPGGMTQAQWEDVWSGSERYDRREAASEFVDTLPKNLSTAQFLLDHDMAPAIVNQLESFDVLPPDIAIGIIKSKGDYLAAALLGQPEKFTSLNRDVANTLIEQGEVSTLLVSGGDFEKGVFDSDLALRILEQDYSSEYNEELMEPGRPVLEGKYSSHANALALAKHLDKFDTLDGRVLHGLVDATWAEVDQTDIVTPEIPDRVINKFYVFKDVDKHDIETVKSDGYRKWLEECPREVVDPNTGEVRPVSENARNRWFGEMSYAYLEGGFSKTAIGKVIRKRIEAGIETDLHDASQWLSAFGIGILTMDSKAILRDRKNADFDPEQYGTVLLKDVGSEKKFFAQLIHMDPEIRMRLNLSGKDAAVEQLFSAPRYQVLYRAAMLPVDGVPAYKHAGFSFATLEQLAGQVLEDYDQEFGMGHAKEETTYLDDADQIRADIHGEIAMLEMAEPPDETRISETIRHLKVLGLARRNYIQDTQNWLLQHATSPNARLTKVWKDRGRALLDGVADNPRAIELWQFENGLKSLITELESSGELIEDYGYTAEEIMSEDMRLTRETLLGVMSAEDSLLAMAKLREWGIDRGDAPKVLPAEVVPVVIEETKKDKEGEKKISLNYAFEILPDGDPRGFTIGHETGCCMVQGGESESCIEAGYQLPNAGFLAVYPPGSDTSGAQSFWYVHPQHPEVLVLDNIEANEGRDLDKIAEVYRKGLLTYFGTHPELGFKEVHVGTGYTDISLGDAPPAFAVPPLKNGIYTDARNQRLLLKL